ncbi:MAG: hypothetical protein O2931_08365 [Planctomycetota bacterium]|nr:hypothetical protein [Planctomycetota bacterium]
MAGLTVTNKPAAHPAIACTDLLAMFSVNQKRQIADAVQKILRDTDHPELPKGEIQFLLHVDGAESWSWADICNNGAVTQPGVNPWNEMQALIK